jgi:hypothetical protein
MIIRSSIFNGYTIGVLLFVLVNTILPAQDKNSFMIKNSLNFNWQHDIEVIKDDISYSSLYDTTQVFSMSFVNPSVMFGTSHGSHHEIELSQLAFSNNEVALTIHYDSLGQQGRISQFDEKIFQLGVAYFYNYRLSRKQKSLEFFLGTGVSYATSSTTRLPVSAQIHPWYTRKFNKQQLDILLRPKILYHLSPKFVLDFNAGLSVFQYYRYAHTREGSVFTTQPEQATLEKEDFFAQLFRMSIGIGYKI